MYAKFVEWETHISVNLYEIVHLFLIIIAHILLQAN